MCATNRVFFSLSRQEPTRLPNSRHFSALQIGLRFSLTSSPPFGIFSAYSPRPIVFIAPSTSQSLFIPTIILRMSCHEFHVTDFMSCMCCHGSHVTYTIPRASFPGTRPSLFPATTMNAHVPCSHLTCMQLYNLSIVFYVPTGYIISPNPLPSPVPHSPTPCP